MIIFSLEALADDSHRRHFIENPYAIDGESPECNCSEQDREFSCPFDDWSAWQPNYQAYYDACDGDSPVEQVCDVLDSMMVNTQDVEIWTTINENFRNKIEDWFEKNIRNIYVGWNFQLILKMRPIGDNSPAHELKERWLKELWPKLDPVAEEGKEYKRTDVDFVFESDPESIRMFRNHGIFTFDCNQNKE